MRNRTAEVGGGQTVKGLTRRVKEVEFHPQDKGGAKQGLYMSEGEDLCLAYQPPGCNLES